MQLKEALSDIAEMRAHLDRNHAYRGFRSIAIGLSALFVLAGAFVQLQHSRDMARMPARYLDIWLCVAVGSLAVTTIEMIIRGRISNDVTVWKMHGKVAASILPAFFVGALLTAVLVFEGGTSLTISRRNLWVLPGVWALIYSLGLFASSNLLHRMTRIAAGYFLLAGVAFFWFNWSQRRIEAWHMVAIFGVGQFMLAGILYWKVERNRG